MVSGIKKRGAHVGRGFASSSPRGFTMSQNANCRHAPAGGEGEQQLRRLLTEALHLADRLVLPPEIGARIQEVLELVDHCLGAGGKFD